MLLEERPWGTPGWLSQASIRPRSQRQETEPTVRLHARHRLLERPLPLPLLPLPHALSLSYMSSIKKRERENGADGLAPYRAAILKIDLLVGEGEWGNLKQALC